MGGGTQTPVLGHSGRVSAGNGSPLGGTKAGKLPRGLAAEKANRRPDQLGQGTGI